MVQERACIQRRAAVKNCRLHTRTCTRGAHKCTHVPRKTAHCKWDPSPPGVLPNFKSIAYLIQSHSSPTEALSSSTSVAYLLQSHSSPSEALNGSTPAAHTANDPKGRAHAPLTPKRRRIENRSRSSAPTQPHNNSSKCGVTRVFHTATSSLQRTPQQRSDAAGE
ncbi:hypothetical protein NDU88_005566 [Pleurodeles waltl]|uniref:Uncharacterized protein n=1 Tax=Pleurodeles waltl TaxID=8319 RepID=A0AAV7UIK0_PLEWA|nr:hypothetical protein NDU88_005566 [Pleurodeles waltl]